MKLHVLWGRPDKNTPIDIHEVSLPIAGLAEAIIGLRLALITDLHYGRFVGDEYTSCVIEQVNAQCPDLICLLGDMVNSSVSQIGSCAELLAGLHAPLGILGCLGNHEYFAGPQTAAKEYRRCGIDVLINAHRRVAVGGAGLVIAGVDDLISGRADLGRALAGLDGAEPVILMSHSPDQAECLDGDLRVDLIISGHTHGGQIVLAGRSIMTRTHHKKYARGLVAGPHCPVYISRGVGVVAMPVRINCRPEIPIIRLVRA